MKLRMDEFLEHVLPDRGYYCAVSIKSTGGRKVVKSGFCRTIAELSSRLGYINAQGHDAYMACSTFEVPQRNQGTVAAVRSFWLDIDVGSNKSYENQEHAIAAVHKFCTEIGMPFPTVVSSGYGIHVYWSLEECVDRESWVIAAGRLKQVARNLGLRADPSRTADSASILRPIETYNFKRRDEGARVVYPIYLAGRIPNERWFVRMPRMPATVYSAGIPNGPDLPGLRQDDGGNEGNPHKPIGISIGSFHLNESSSGVQAVEHCGQLRRFRDSGGNISEPLWYACLGVLAQCEDGRQLAHRWSSGYAGYTEAETDAKLYHAGTAASATTCARFKELDEAGCKGCPHNVASPVQLGRGTVANLQPVRDPDDHAVHKADGEQTGEQQAGGMPALPRGYEWGRGQALVAVIPSGNDSEPPKRIVLSRYPVYLRQVLGSEKGIGGTSLEFNQWLPHEGWKKYTVIAKDFYGQSGFGFLAANGSNIPVRARPAFIDYVQKAQDLLRQQKEDTMRFEQFGWKPEGSFLSGNILFKPNGQYEAVELNDDLTIEARKMGIAEGTVGEWGAAADQLFQADYEAQGFTMLCGFAAPLMRFASGAEGGTIVSLYSKDSGTGKSTAAFAALSIWGKPDEMKLVQRDNQVPLFHTFSLYRHLPLLYDDMTKRDPQIVRDFVIAFTDGRDKKRGKVDGTNHRVMSGWNTILITTSNRSLLDILQAEGDVAQAVRVIEFTLPRIGKAAHNIHLLDTFKRLTGIVGAAWSQYIAREDIHAWLATAVPEAERYFLTQLEAGGEGRFIARLLATVFIASKLLTEQLHALNFDVDRLMEWALKQAHRHLHHVETNEASGGDAVQIISDLIAKNIIDCLIVREPWKARVMTQVVQMPRRDLRMRYEISVQRLYIAQGAMRKWLLNARQSYSDVVSQLMEKGILLDANKRLSLSAGTDLPGGQAGCWMLDLSHPLMSGTVKEVKDGIAPEVRIEPRSGNEGTGFGNSKGS